MNNRIDAVYARQSIDKKDSISIESQIESCKYELRGGSYREYKDKGYSGKNTDRPDFQRLLSDIEAGQIAKVVVYKLDRISRSILDFARLMELFQRHNVEFVSSTEKFDTSTPMGRAMLNICIVFAQLERESIQQRVTDAWHSRCQKGFKMGGKTPYGFRTEPYVMQGIKTKRLVTEPTEAEFVKLMYEMYLDPRMSLRDITRTITAQGMKTYHGRPLSRATLSIILRNPIYVMADLDIYEFFKSQGTEIVNSPEDFIGTNGCYYYQGKGNTDNKHTNLQGQTLVLAPHEGFIPSDIWLKVRKKLMASKSFQPGRKASNSWLAGKIKCGRCGYVRDIFRWKLEGQSAQGIANRLNSLGVLSPMEYKKAAGLSYLTTFKTSNKAKWSAVAVRRILRDEVYIGTMVQGKYATPNHKIKKKFQKPPEDWERVAGTHEAIISREEFQLANSLLSRDTRIAPGESAVYPFSGIAVCGNCHENMIRRLVQVGDKRYVYYICSSGCKGYRIGENDLTDGVTAAVRDHISNILNLERILLFIDGLPLKQDEVKRLDRQIMRKREEIERYKKLIFSLYENLQNGLLNETEYRRMKESYNVLHTDAEQALGTLTREVEDIISCKGEKNVWIEYFKQYHNFSELTRKLLVAVTDRIVIYPKSRLEINFRYQYDYMRALSFAEAVSELHPVPGNELLTEVV